MPLIMPEIAFITDTDSSLPEDLAARYHIQQVPITVQFGEESYLTGVDIDDTALFERVDREHQLPTTAAPSPGQFLEAYQTAFTNGAETVLCFTVSSAISTTYSSAVTAHELLPERDITVVDTRQLSLAQAFIVLAAAEAAQQGASKEVCLARAQAVGERVHLFTALSTVKYLAMSGRIGSIAAGMAGLLNIKPILTSRDGKLDMLEKVRTPRKSWERLIELTSEAAAGRRLERVGIAHVAALPAAQDFAQQLRARLNCLADILFAELTPGLSVHTGSGLVGVVCVTEQ
jgi:DegV family protein with EDD domain